MKMKIYLDVEGQESVATGRDIWPWHYTVRPAEGYGNEAPKGAVLLGECEVTLPTKEACIPPVLELLKMREQEINAQAHEDLTKIKERRDSLLMLTLDAQS